MSSAEQNTEKKGNPVANFFGNIFRWNRRNKKDRGQGGNKPSKAAAAAAKAEFDQVRPTETLAAFKRPAPPRKRKGSRPTVAARPEQTEKHLSHMSDVEEEEVKSRRVSGRQDGLDSGPTQQQPPQPSIPIPPNVANYLKSKKNDNTTKSSDKLSGTNPSVDDETADRLEHVSVELRKSALVETHPERVTSVQRAQSLNNSTGAGSASGSSRPPSSSRSRPISTTFQPDTSHQEENLTKLRKDSNEEVELLTESVNVRQIVQRLSCPPGGSGPHTAPITPPLPLTPRPKTYTDPTDLAGLVSQVQAANQDKPKRKSSGNMATNQELTVA